MRIVVNGEPIDVDASTATVQGLLEAKNLTASPCAVEVNATLIPKRHHPEYKLNDGDRVEIVTLVGGG